MKKLFKLEDYKGKYVMHCKTKKEAEDFLDVLHRNKRTWETGESYIKFNNWDDYKSETCYDFNEGSYANREFWENEGYTALDWEDFEVFRGKEDLENGMVVELKNKDRFVVHNGNLLSEELLFSLKLYDTNLNYRELIYRDSLSIEKVYISNPVNLNDFKKDYALLKIWERKKATVLTIEEVKEKFGIDGELYIVEK